MDNSSQQIDKKVTKQVRIDSGLHRLLKVRAAKAGKSLKEVLEGLLAEYLAVDDKYSEDY